MPPADQDELTRVLGKKPPAALKALSAADRSRLAQTIEHAQQMQIEAIAEATDNALRHIPRPMRGAIRRIFGNG